MEQQLSRPPPTALIEGSGEQAMADERIEIGYFAAGIH
jgi:hypothetical protein